MSASFEYPDEEGRRSWWSLRKRFVLAAVLIVALSAGATATLALNTVSGIAEEVFPKLSQISAPKGLVTPEYNEGSETFLVLGTDRREGSKDAFDREDPPHSDTMLLVRFDPEQGQTSVLSIPRDLMVNITAPNGAVYAGEKINAAYQIGSQLGGTRGGMLLAAETIKREIFPELKLNAIVDVNFRGFIRVVDSLGCAYVNVDHRYFNENIGTPETNYTSINLQPGYQKLCYENALDYVRYRHTDDDFVRVARQQDFIRDLREQVSTSDILGQIDKVAKAVGHAIASTVHGSADELLKLAKLIAFSQSKPLRQVKFLTTEIDAQIHGGSYVTSTPELEQKTLNTFLNGDEALVLPAAAPRRSSRSSHSSSHSRRASQSSSRAAAAIGLYPTAPGGEEEAVKASAGVPFPVLYPTLQTGPAEQQQVRAYTLKDPSGGNHHAYVIVWQQNIIGGYYDLEGTDWTDPPLFNHARSQTIGSRQYMIVDDGSHIHVVGWRSGYVLYWLTNTLLEELSNSQMLALAGSAQPLR
jgi:LCP family protein required for cell wall assembly